MYVAVVENRVPLSEKSWNVREFCFDRNCQGILLFVGELLQSNAICTVVHFNEIIINIFLSFALLIATTEQKNCHLNIAVVSTECV